LPPIKGFIDVSILESGKGFGELALIHKQPRAATIRCVKYTHFATLDKHDFDTSVL
jgi:CRP-like cAMP-binding protein